MKITYQLSPNLSIDSFIDILNRSTLGERRPVDDLECIESMIKSAPDVKPAEGDRL